MNYIRPEHQVAVDAELARLRDLATELELPVELVAANELQLRKRALLDTRQALADAVAGAHQVWPA